MPPQFILIEEQPPVSMTKAGIASVVGVTLAVKLTLAVGDGVPVMLATIDDEACGVRVGRRLKEIGRLTEA